MPKGPAAALRQKLKDDRSKRFREAQMREHGAARASQAALARRTAGAAYGTATGALDRMSAGIAAAEASPRFRTFREAAGRVGSRAAGAAGRLGVRAAGAAAEATGNALGYVARNAAGAAGNALGYVARNAAGAAGNALGYVARKAASAGADLGARALSGAYRGIRAIPTAAQDALYNARRAMNERNVRMLEQRVAEVAARVARGPLAAADT